MADDDDPLRDPALAGARAGLAWATPRPYIRAMGFFRRFSPIDAYRDLRLFLATRERHEFAFLTLAIAVTGVLVYAFVRDNKVEVPYQPHITYVKSWRLDRSDDEIKAQQVIDEAARKKQHAADEAERAKTRAEFKRLDDSLSNMGF